MAAPVPCYIYRITHFDNLEGILNEGGLWCGNEMTAREWPYKQIGLQDLTLNRAQKEVPAKSGGNLNDYVPFYFCPRSVMLFQIHTGKVPTYQEGQEPVLHLVSAVQKVVKSGLAFAFTDLHAKTNLAEFSDDVGKLDKLDWETIKSTDFKRRDDDPSRLDRKQAEFLIHRFVPWDCILGIGVHSQKWKKDCEAILQKVNLTTPVQVKTRWYF